MKKMSATRSTRLKLVHAYTCTWANEVYVLGDDCMDGHGLVYSSLLLLAAADLAARMGQVRRTIKDAFRKNLLECDR